MKKNIIIIALIICLITGIIIFKCSITNNSNPKINGEAYTTIDLGEGITGTIYDDGRLIISGNSIVDPDKLSLLPFEKINSIIISDENVGIDYDSWFKLHDIADNIYLELPSEAWFFKNQTSDMSFSFKTIVFNNTSEIFFEGFTPDNIFKIAHYGIYSKELTDNKYILLQKDIKDFKKGNNIILDDNIVSIGYDALENLDNIEKIVIPDAAICYSEKNTKFFEQVEQIDVYENSKSYNYLKDDFSEKLNIIKRVETTPERNIEPISDISSIPSLKPYKTENPSDNLEFECEFDNLNLINNNLIGFEDSYQIGCSRWCGVLRYIEKFTASSTLSEQGNINYFASNLSESVRNTSWVEGASGSGIGEYIDLDLNCLVGENEQDFYEICIVNGYAENNDLWKENNRIKKLLMYVNGKPYKYLYLEDTINPQYFDLSDDPIRVKSGATTWYRFEIADIYQGTKYDDTCLTYLSLNFTGGGH